MASNYATASDLNNLRTEVLRLTSSIKEENVQIKSQLNNVLDTQNQLTQQIASLNGQGKTTQGDKGIGFYGQQAFDQGGPRGTGWQITNPASIVEYRGSKAAVSPDYYDCTNKKVTDIYGREMPDPANQLPYWSCPGDPSTYAIDREDYVSRLAYPDLNPYPMQVPFGLQI